MSSLPGLALPFEYYATAQQNGYLANRFEWKSKTMTMPKGWDGRNKPLARLQRPFFLSPGFLVNEIIIPVRSHTCRRAGVKGRYIQLQIYTHIKLF